MERGLGSVRVGGREGRVRVHASGQNSAGNGRGTHKKGTRAAKESPGTVRGA